MVGIDKHNKGIRLIARVLRDHGLEVVYVGEHNTSRQLAEVAVSEDADFVGVSFVNGNYVPRIKELLTELDAVGASDIRLVVGGLIHPDDVAELEQSGVAAVFGPETSVEEIVATIDEKFGSVAQPGAGTGTSGEDA